MPTANYLIFARKAYQQPLEWIGQLAVEAGPGGAGASPDEVCERARGQFGAEAWLELVAIPEAAVLRIIPTE